LIYNPHKGLVLSDLKIEEYIKNLIESNFTGEIIVSNDLIITAFRVFVKRGLISIKDIEIIYNNKIVVLDKHGNLNYPSDYPDIESDYLIELTQEI